MAALTNYSANSLLKHILRLAAFTQPAGLYIGLFLVAPTKSYAGVEVSGNGYAREAVTFLETPNNIFVNTADLYFEATGGSWGNILGIGIFDASTSGNLLFFGTPRDLITVGTNEILKLPANVIGVTLN